MNSSASARDDRHGEAGGSDEEGVKRAVPPVGVPGRDPPEMPADDG